MKIVIYHADCLDGFGAAYSAWLKYPDAVFYSAKYGEEPPKVDGSDVYVLDFSYPKEVLLQMASQASSITLIDHHKTAKEQCHDLIKDRIINGIFDMNKSGAVLSWEYFHPLVNTPDILRHIQDRDLWKFEMDGTKEVCASLFSMPFNFELWHSFTRNRLYEEGIAILRKHQKDINALELLAYESELAGFDILSVNCSYMFASDLGNILSRETPFACCWYFDGDNYNYSLRSQPDGYDVSEIAKLYSGGGHKNAAGFRSKNMVINALRHRKEGSHG